MRTGAVIVAALVVLSGCSAVSFGSDGQPGASTDTVTPVPITDTDAGATGTATPVDLPPGVSADGSVDAVELSRAHEAFLENRTYTWFVDYDTGEEDFVGGVFTRRAVVGNESFFVQQVSLGPGANTSLYVNESGGFLRAVEGNETRYEMLRIPGQQDEYAFAGDAILRFLDGTQFDVTTVERGGQAYYRLHTADGPIPQTLASSSVDVRNYSATAYVTPEGFVRSLTAEYDRVVRDTQTHVSFRYDYSGVGESTPEPPTWVDDVQRRSTPEPAQPGTPAQNGTATPDGSTSTPEAPTPTDELDG
ncbi:hypothetical protein [Halosimplex sp. TS25]|uniref:hypothetical protein n=1 Tax=Halosimplex rarum TaxID=3396619 RepID=UPI0039EB8C33